MDLDSSVRRRSIHSAPLRCTIVRLCLIAVAIGCVAGDAIAAEPPIETSPDRAKTPLNPGLRQIGTIRPRSADEISGSNWTLGCETLDRDYADYQQYKGYLVPLGIKTIRLQGGWAKTERVKGGYDFTWLDTIIDDARGRGLNILLETGYGNSVYEGGGGWDLAGGFPTSAEGLAAWDRWVEAMLTICDFNHAGREINRKGLLRATADKRVEKIKLAYFSVQNCVAVFDDTLERAKEPAIIVTYDKPTACFAYGSKATGQNLIVLWDNSATPDDSFVTHPAQVEVKDLVISEPVWVDLVSGRIYEIPAARIRTANGTTIFQDIPLYDAPVLIAAKSTFMPAVEE